MNAEESFREAISIYHTSIQKVLRSDDEVRRSDREMSGRKEVRNLMKNKTLIPMRYSSMNAQQKGNVHRSFMFLKDKLNAAGVWESYKARLVINGSTVNVDEVGDLYAGTVNPISIMTMIAVATMNNYNIAAFDIKGAYLIPEVDSSEPDIMMKVDREVAGLFVKEYPHLNEFVEADGTMHFKLRKYLYGLPQAAAHFAKHLANTFKKMGFKRLKVDSCVWVKDGKNGQCKISAGTHVDDILVTGSDEDIDQFEIDLKKYYEIVSDRGKNISYISLYIETDNVGNRIVSQKGFRKELISRYRSDIDNIKAIIDTPSCGNLLEDDDNDVEYKDKSHYLSIIMALMYLARLTRYEILFTVSYLATKGTKPSMRHYKAACRVLRYIECSGDYGIVFKKD